MSSGVSVVVPSRNRSHLLATTLHSVLWQSDVDLEVIVVDDASTDDTADVVAGFADPRVTIVRQPESRGPSAARNRGARQARGEWISFVDDDDVWAPDKLVRQVAAAKLAGRDWAYGGVVNIGSRLEIISGAPPPTPQAVVAALPRYNPVPGGGSNVVLRRGLLDELGGFDERFPPCEDWELWIRLARTGLPASVDRPQVGYRLHSVSSSLDAKRVWRSALLIEEVHAARVDWGRLHRWMAESCLRRESHTRALGHFARAAVRGQASGVASDLAAIVRRRLAGRVRDRAAHATPAGKSWGAAEASVWLGALEEHMASGSDEVGRR